MEQAGKLWHLVGFGTMTRLAYECLQIAWYQLPDSRRETITRWLNNASGMSLETAYAAFNPETEIGEAVLLLYRFIQTARMHTLAQPDNMGGWRASVGVL